MMEEVEELKEEERQGQPLHLHSFLLQPLPTIIYIPNFITQSQQAQFLHQIYEVSSSRWKSLKNRRLQNWGGVVHEKGLLPQELPPWLKTLTNRMCEQTGLFPSPINHVLINEYLPDQGIMPHQDGPAYFPVVAILSLNSSAVIDFTPHPRLKESVVGANGSSNELISKEDVDHQPYSVLLSPCSLLIFKDHAYADYLHGIQDSEVHRLDKVLNISEIQQVEEMKSASCFRRTSTRVSLTCRLVLKVHRKLFKF